MHLAIFKVNHLGDNVVFLPVVQALRRLRPDWRLTVVTAPHVADLYAAAVPRERLITVRPDDLKRAWRRPWIFLRWVRRLRAQRFDAALVSYDQTSVAHGLARLAGGRVRVGAAGLRIRLRGTLTREIAVQSEWSVARWNWETARALVADLGGAADWPADPPAPDLGHLTGGVARDGRRVVIHAGSNWDYTRWPLARFAELAARLAAERDVVWIDAPETRGAALASRVRRQAAGDLRALAELLASAGLFIGNNSGPMHIANAIGTPSVIVCGPSSPMWDPAWRAENTRLLRTPGLVCLPCDRGVFAAMRCGNAAEPHACMARWSVDAVEAECRAALARVEARR
ncbi:MAG: hypothetical protein RLZZ15_2955 [Verrucomicrobiota bacterium]